MPKKEESSKRQDPVKSEKPHGQKTAEPKIQVEKARGAGKENTPGSGMRTTEEKELGKVKGTQLEDFSEKNLGSERGRGLGKSSLAGKADKGDPGLEKPEGIDLGNIGGIDISNFDPTSDLGKKASGKGCLPAIIGIIMVAALIIIF